MRKQQRASARTNEKHHVVAKRSGGRVARPQRGGQSAVPQSQRTADPEECLSVPAAQFAPRTEKVTLNKAEMGTR